MKSFQLFVAVMVWSVGASAAEPALIAKNGLLLAQAASPQTLQQRAPTVPPGGGATLVAPGVPKAATYCCSSCSSSSGTTCTQAGGVDVCPASQCLVSCACGETVQGGAVTCHKC